MGPVSVMVTQRPDSQPLRDSATLEDAKRARTSLGQHLNYPPWLRGIGITQASCIDCPQPFQIAVRVAREEDRALVPATWDGFPVETIAVGDIRALGSVGQAPSPWWALWVNFGGTGDWKFVGWYYAAPDQDLAAGRPRAVVDRIIQGLADQLTSPAVALNATGEGEVATAQPSGLAGTTGRPVEWI